MGPLLQGRDMLCFSHDWSGDPLSKTHLMRLLAKENRVLWVNSIGYRTPKVCKRDMARAWQKLKAAAAPLCEVEPNLFVFNPLVVPVYGPTGRRINRWLLRHQVRHAMRRLGFSRPINWVFNPAAAIIAGTLGEEIMIYYCVDEYTAFSDVQRTHLESLERELLAKADMVIVSAQRLLQTKSSGNALTILVRHGVDYAHFRRALDPATAVPAELAGLPRPILGYFGLLGKDWVDVPLLEHVAQSFPHASLVLVGKSTMDLTALSRRANVHLLGRKPYQDLPGYCKAFDVGLIPFPISEVTLSANPLKAREYLASGLPVVSTAIPEVQALGQCRIGTDAADFARQIAAALHDPTSREARSGTMASETWVARLEEIARHLAARGLIASADVVEPMGLGDYRAQPF